MWHARTHTHGHINNERIDQGCHRVGIDLLSFLLSPRPRQSCHRGGGDHFDRHSGSLGRPPTCLTPSLRSVTSPPLCVRMDYGKSGVRRNAACEIRFCLRSAVQLRSIFNPFGGLCTRLCNQGLFIRRNADSRTFPFLFPPLVRMHESLGVNFIKKNLSQNCN